MKAENKQIIAMAAILLALVVALGAFGAHGLKNKLTEHQLSIYKTGVIYHFFHALGLVVLGSLSYLDRKPLKIIAALFILGILFFSGSLYLLACREWFGIMSWKFLGPMTPIGGLFFISGWISLAYFTLRSKSE